MIQKARQTLTTWVAVYPTITALILILEPLISDWPVPARTLLLSALMVPIMVFWVLPVTNRLILTVSRVQRPILASTRD